ncbi:MAG: flavodoxin-dependent (E)-4-hydroxy-3-methylbut-2-enyl-diphosphate synthase, partial [Candidatus Omnitrophica bacterium]|nr:flavodoxin-dependent (E)-4-hydroxy-3-methylbut-2-enyl-diphosphate synthase [Candidatus Omnitrophota bacterium]
TIEDIKFCEDNGFFDIVVSLKTPYVKTTIEAYREIFDRCNYPLHLGVTEAGYGDTGVAKSILGIGILLFEGIGDTIRVSLTDTPEREVRIAQAILQALELRKFEPEIISCPVCGRCQVPVKKIASKIKDGIMDMMIDNPFLKNLTIAIMGCSVNGPGEAKQADIGIAGGKDRFTLFAKGNIIGTYPTKVIEKIFFEKIKEISNG